jgi:regulator of ribonuclease activity B
MRALMPDDLPNDSDGDALRRLVRDGSDLSKPMTIDFAVAVPDKFAGEAVAERASSLGFRPHIYHDAKDDSWTCNCTKVLVPDYCAIVAIQKRLDEISRPFGGKSDGWGSFGNAAVHNGTRRP